MKRKVKHEAPARRRVIHEVSGEATVCPSRKPTATKMLPDLDIDAVSR